MSQIMQDHPEYLAVTFERASVITQAFAALLDAVPGVTPDDMPPAIVEAYTCALGWLYDHRPDTLDPAFVAMLDAQIAQEEQSHN